MSTSRWQFRALDTWFFRESRPMESIEEAELQSTFPPSIRTVAGAIRYLVGEQHNVAWSDWYKADSYPKVKKLIGDAASYGGTLRFSGPWLVRVLANGERERLYPAPAHLVAVRDEQGVMSPVRLLVGSPHRCDLGDAVRMAEVPKPIAIAMAEQKKKLKSLDNFWVSAKTLRVILSGGNCDASDLIGSESLFDEEARLGISRNNLTRSVEPGMLYQTRHVRPRQQVKLEVDVTGLSSSDHPAEGVVRLGGEGRGAVYTVTESLNCAAELKGVTDVTEARGMMLMLLTPSQQPEKIDNQYSPLPGFKQCETVQGTVWKGSLNDIDLTLHCAIQAKELREGGWDLANNRPREVQSLVPSGSVYYMTVDDGNIQAAIEKIHLSQLPSESEGLALGRGLVAAGIWPKNEWVEKE